MTQRACAASAAAAADSGHRDFEEGRRLRAADLNAESQVRADEAAGHRALSHPGPADDPRLVGASLTHPRRHPSLDVVVGGPGARVRVTVREPGPDLELGATRHHAAGALTARHVKVGKTLRLQSRPLPQPPAAAPWSVRAVDVLDEAGRLAGRELRVELSAPQGFPAQESRVSVGLRRTGTSPGYAGLLMVDADGNVTVDGDLEVAGSVSQGEIGPDPDDPRFAALLTDLVARRVVGAAATSSDTVLGLAVTVDDTRPDQTALTVSIQPTRALTRYGLAWQTRRGTDSRFRLVGVGGPVASGTKTQITTPPVTWDPPLTDLSKGNLDVVAAGFDARGALHAQRFTRTGLKGHA